MRFIPDRRRAALVALAIGPSTGLAALGYLVLRAARRGWPAGDVGWQDVANMVGLALIVGMPAAAFYFVVFVRRAPRAVTIEDTLEVESRDGSVTRIAWSEVRTARYSAAMGPVWRFAGPFGALAVRDVGFRRKTWKAIGRAVTAALRRHGVEPAAGNPAVADRS